MQSKISVLGLAVQASLAISIPRPCTCPSISGNKTIDAYQLYPENVDFDTRRCLLYSRLVLMKLKRKKTSVDKVLTFVIAYCTMQLLSHGIPIEGR